MLKTRILTAAIALPVVLAAIMFLPNIGFSIFIALVGAWELCEIATMIRPSGVLSIVVLLSGLSPLLTPIVRTDLLNLTLSSHPYLLALAGPGSVFALMFGLILEVALRGATPVHERARSQPLLLQVIGAAWVGMITPYFALLRNLPDGIHALLFMLLVVIASDTGAYFGGRQFGAHKLAERVSPNKTIEGAIAGLIASIVAGLILRPWLMPQWSLAATSAISAAIATLAQLGDLANSAFKRTAGVKDSGWIFPGHGGLLDRTCSLLFAAAFTYYCVR